MDIKIYINIYTAKMTFAYRMIYIHIYIHVHLYMKVKYIFKLQLIFLHFELSNPRHTNPNSNLFTNYVSFLFCDMLKRKSYEINKPLETKQSKVKHTNSGNRGHICYLHINMFVTGITKYTSSSQTVLVAK